MEQAANRTGFASVETAVADIRAGRMVMVVDDEKRENEGDLIVAGCFATPEIVNFMAVNARGLICMPVSASIARRLGLGPMTRVNTDNHCTAFTESVDYIDTDTGISAFDRSLTAQKISDTHSKADDFRKPGHLFPLVAVADGTLRRAGHTETTTDLCRLAGLSETGLCCEIMSADGHMARLPELRKRAEEWGISLISVADLIIYRKQHEQFMECAASAALPTRYGDFTVYAFINRITGAEHSALVMGSIADGQPVLCRVHSECRTGDTFGSLKCDCGQQFDAAMRKIAERGRGVLVYMNQEGRGIGFVNKIKAYRLQDEGFDTVDANLKLGFPEDMRDYSECVQILRLLGVQKLLLMTNNPLKLHGLGIPGSGIEITKRIPLEISPRKQDRAYLITKRTRMGHLITNV